MSHEEGRQFFIGGLSRDTTDDDLRAYFESFGGVLEAKVMRLKGTSQSRGFGFVTLQEAADLPLPLEGHSINGKAIEVKVAVPATEMHTLVRTRRCFVGALPREITVDELALHFKQFGRVVAVELPHDKATSKFLNCAFVTFEKDDAADAAVRVSIHEFHGKRADVKKADPKPQKDCPTCNNADPSGYSIAPTTDFYHLPPGLPVPHPRSPLYGPPPKPRRTQDVTGMYFVGGLNRNTTNEDLAAYFAEFGEVKSARVAISEGRSRGFAFVTFAAPERAVAAGLMTRVHTLQGNTLDVKSAVPEDELTTVTRTKRIFVGALPPTATKEIMWEHFQQFGRIVDCDIVYDKMTQRPKGCGFVVFESEDHAENATRFPSHTILGQRVDVKKAEPRSSQPSNPNFQVTHGLTPQGPKRAKKPPDAADADSSVTLKPNTESLVP